METAIYLLMLQLLLFATASSAVTLLLLLRYRPSGWLWYALAKTGIAVTSLILFFALIPNPTHTIPLNWTVVGYMLALVFTSVGMIGVSLDLARKAARAKLKKEVNT